MLGQVLTELGEQLPCGLDIGIEGPVQEQETFLFGHEASLNSCRPCRRGGLFGLYLIVLARLIGRSVSR